MEDPPGSTTISAGRIAAISVSGIFGPSSFILIEGVSLVRL
jgi:hypothetical protein